MKKNYERIAALARSYIFAYQQPGNEAEVERLIEQLHKATTPAAKETPPVLGIHVSETVTATDKIR